LQRRIESLHKSPTLVRAVQKSSWLSFLWVFSRDDKVGVKFRVFHHASWQTENIFIVLFMFFFFEKCEIFFLLNLGITNPQNPNPPNSKENLKYY
jgi:hypothetical protein